MHQSPTAADLAAILHDSIANLEAHIEARAAELAAQRTAVHAEVCAEYERRLDAAEQRRQDVVGEFRRQMAILERRAAEGDWLTRYLPEHFVRAAGLKRPCDTAVLREGWAASIEQVAVEVGLDRGTPAPAEQ
jgi:hypothetical protein